MQVKRYATILVMVAGLFLTAGAAMAQNAAGSVTGWWLDATGRAGILVTPCDNNTLCGRIEWLREPHNAAGTPVLDVHNEDASLRNRQVCGLLMMGKLVANGPGAWKDGWIYDPASGKTYKATMHLRPDGTLSLRGYIGIPLIGRSSVWTRPTTPLTPCTGT